MSVSLNAFPSSSFLQYASPLLSVPVLRKLAILYVEEHVADSSPVYHIPNFTTGP